MALWISEALAGELEPFGIRVLIVEPGPFRADFLGRSITVAANEMPEYAASSRRRYRETNNGNQAGGPDKTIAVILRAVDADDAPLHLPLGPIAHAIAERKLAAFRSVSTGPERRSRALFERQNLTGKR